MVLTEDEQPVRSNMRRDIWGLFRELQISVTEGSMVNER